MATTLRGSVVRHRIAQLGWDLAKAGEASGIPSGTLKNNTREHDPQPIKLVRAYALLAALNQPGHDPLKIEDILRDGGDGGVPDEPPAKKQERETNTGPGRKESGGQGTGPGRFTERVAS